MVLIRGAQPVLVDTGFGSDAAATDRLLREAGVAPEQLALIVNTHYHADHVGGNHYLQRRYAIPIAAHRWDALLVNRRDREVGGAEWGDVPVQSYHVDWSLTEGDIIDAGGPQFQVLHTPGHALGHIALYAPDEQILLCGDAMHADDVGWINSFREGTGALERALDTVRRFATLPIRQAYSGHGAAITDPPRAIDAAQRRYEEWLTEPVKLAWHACKRIFTYVLMVKDGLAGAEVLPYLVRCPWLQDYSRYCFEQAPQDFAPRLLAEMLRSGAAEWRCGRLMARAFYTPPQPHWLVGPARPRDWVAA